MSEASSPDQGSKDATSDWASRSRGSVHTPDSSDSDQEEVRVTAPRFEAWHDSWDAFFASLGEYQKQTSQLYRIRTTVKATARNQVIKTKKRWTESELIPEAFGDYYKKFLCTHGWNKSARGQGRRTGHHERSCGCDVVLCATVMRCCETGTFRICVTKHKRSHNHKLDRNVFEHYPSNRRVTDPDVLDVVDEIIKAGGKPKKILKYLKDTTGKCVECHVQL